MSLQFFCYGAFVLEEVCDYLFSTRSRKIRLCSNLFWENKWSIYIFAHIRLNRMKIRLETQKIINVRKKERKTYIVWNSNANCRNELFEDLKNTFLRFDESLLYVFIYRSKSILQLWSDNKSYSERLWFIIIIVRLIFKKKYKNIEISCSLQGSEWRS